MTTGSVLAQFTITLSQAVSEQVAVEWHTADGTALAGVDYAAAKGTVLFAPGQTAKTVDILVHGRAVGAEDRSFFVEMLPPTNAILGASIGECIIHVDTSGSTPVTQIIVPTGPIGPTGKSAYQSWLDQGNTGTEQDFINSYYPDPADIAQDVAPLIDVGATTLTADGTETLGHPDATTVKAVARRVAYVGASKIATVALADGDNLISTADLTGDAVDFKSVGLYPRILRGSAILSPQWRVETDGRLLIKGAAAGDVLYVCQYDIASGQAVTRLSREALRRSYAEAGLNLVDGSFEAGGTVTSAADVLLYEANGIAYSRSTELPYAVPEGSTLDSTGGVGVGAWQPKNSSSLRSDMPVFVTAAKYAGGASTSSTNNDAAISAAIADAIATGSYVYWPAVYEVQGNIPNFHSVRHEGPGGIKRGPDTFRVHPLEWHSNKIYTATTGSDTNDGVTASNPLATVQRTMDVMGLWGTYGALMHGNWTFKFLPGTFTEGGSFSGFIPVENYVVFEGSIGVDGLPDVVISGSSSTKTAGLYFFNGPSLIKVDSIAANNFRANSVASGMVFYGKGISEAYTINCAGKNNIWSGINADSIGRWLLTGGTFDANTQYNLRARGGVAIAIGINGTSNKVKLKNNQTAAQIRDGCTGHFDNFEITNDPSLPVGTGVWAANCARVTFNAGSFTNVNLGSLASENATISIGTDVTFTNVNTKFRTVNNGSIDQSSSYSDGQGLGFDAFRNEYAVGQYGYTGLKPASSSSAYALYSTRTGVVDYSFLVNAAARQRLIFGYGSSSATRDKFIIDFNGPSTREDHYIDGAVCLRIKPAAVTSGQDNLLSCGEGGVRWSVVYAATGAINTSDAREKTPPKAINDAILDAADDVNIVLFKWLDSIATKGDDAARWHFGIIAQQLRDAFLAHGIDGTEYGLLCYDEWEDEFEAVTEEYEQEVATVRREGGRLVEVIETQILSRETGEMRKVRTAGNRWGVRPDQCMWLLLSAERRRTAAAIARIDSIEQRLSSAGM